MRIAVIGSRGRTGTAVVEEALRRGHEVIAVARHHDAEAHTVNVVRRTADVTDGAAMRAALGGADAVVNAVGIGSSKAETSVYSEGARAVVDAMEADGISGLVVMSASPAGPRADHRGLQERLLIPILEKVFGASYRDMRRMETQLADNPVNWVAARPPRLLRRRARGSYRTGVVPPRHGRAITIADLATALVDFAERDAPRGALYVAN
jgi:putative NADH-flavin reductase